VLVRQHHLERLQPLRFCLPHPKIAPVSGGALKLVAGMEKQTKAHRAAADATFKMDQRQCSGSTVGRPAGLSWVTDIKLRSIRLD
jgi:hypothetical protein